MEFQRNFPYALRSYHLSLLITIIVLLHFPLIRLGKSAELNKILSNLSANEDDGPACVFSRDGSPTSKIAIEKLRDYENLVFGAQTKRLCGRDVQEFVRVFRKNHELTSGSRLSPQYHDFMDDLRWLDSINDLKCRISDFYDRAAKISLLTLRFPVLKEFLKGKQREQNRLCLEDLRSDIGEILEGAYLTSEQLSKENPENYQKLMEKQKHKLIPEQRQAANFLRYNIENNKSDSSIKLHEFIPAESYYRGAAEYLLPRARKLDLTNFHPSSGKLLLEAQRKHYEAEFNRLVYDACNSVHSELYQFKNYFENIMQISRLPDSSVHQRILEAIGDIQVCEIVINKVYPFSGIFDAMLQVSNENKAMQAKEKRRNH